MTNYDFHYQHGYVLAKPVRDHSGRQDRDHLYLQPATSRRATASASSAAPLRDVGGGLDRRDVPRSCLDDAAEILNPSRRHWPTRSPLGLARARLSGRSQQPRIRSANVYATSKALVGGTPNWEGKPRDVHHQDLPVLSYHNVPAGSAERALPQVAQSLGVAHLHPQSMKVHQESGPSSRVPSPTTQTTHSDSRSGTSTCGRPRSGRSPTPLPQAPC